MAAGPAALPALDDPMAEIPNMRAHINSITDSLTRLQLLVAGLTEDPTGAYGDMGEGPAVRARIYQHSHDSDRNEFSMLKERVNDLENSMAFLTASQTENSQHLEDELTKVRGEIGASRAHTPLDRKNKNITELKGFEKLKLYSGEAAQWKDWRYKVATWLTQTNSSFESLIIKLDQSESEPKEPDEGATMRVGSMELTTEEEWCSEQLYQLLVQKCEGRALAIVRNQNTLGKSRGLVAWYRTLCEAEGQMKTKRSEITERVVFSGRTAVAAKDVVAAIETWEEELLQYKSMTGLTMDNTLMVLNLKRMLPESIKKMLQTVEYENYDEAKEYAIKQARALMKDSKAQTLDLNEKEEDTEEAKKKVTFQTEVPEEEDYDKCTKDELLAWLKKGNGKGNKGCGPKGNKGGFQGNCLYCGAWGHRLNECRKKDADMKGKGKGQYQAPYPNWGSNTPSKGKGKGLSTWNPGKGSGGKGKGAYSVEDEWSEGISGYGFGYEDTPLWYHDLAG